MIALGALKSLGGVVVPTWAKWAALAALLAAVYAQGRLDEARRGADAQVTNTVQVVQRQAKVVTVTETKYRDRIKTVYVKGETLEKSIPTFILAADNARFAVNAGFVRVLDASWSGTAAGPARDSDREPAGVPLDQVASAQGHNATSCRAWREKALGWREFYAGQQRAVNGKPGEWADVEHPDEFVDQVADDD